MILVTKDINLRIKSKALGLVAEDYQTGKVHSDEIQASSSYNIEGLESTYIREIFTKGSVPEDGTLGEKKEVNGYYILKNGKTSALAFYNHLTDRVDRIEKEFIYGIKPKNAEQAFAFHALLKNDIKLVALQGVAGTGKTLLALAAALEQHKLFQQIINQFLLRYKERCTHQLMPMKSIRIIDMRQQILGLQNAHYFIHIIFIHG